MNKAARYGSIVYAKNTRKLAEFYTAFFGMNVTRETPEFIALEIEGFHIIIHTPPVQLSEQRLNTVKLFLTVDSLDQARETVSQYGGSAMDGEWSNPVFNVCNIMDPEGNHIQIREFKP